MTASTEIVMTANTFLPTAKFSFSLKALAAFGFLAFCLCFPDIPARWNGW